MSTELQYERATSEQKRFPYGYNKIICYSQVTHADTIVKLLYSNNLYMISHMDAEHNTHYWPFSQVSYENTGDASFNIKTYDAFLSA